MRPILTKSCVAVLAGLMAIAPMAVSAAPMDAKAAKKLLFKAKGMVLDPVALPDGLAPEIAGPINGLVEQFADRKRLKALEAAGWGYYGALAVPTDAPLQMEHLAFVAKLHSPEAAEAAALATCAKTTGSRACAVVARLLPKSWKPRDLTLSQPATERFRSGWSKEDGPKYLAMSPSTEAWVIAKGPGADAAALQRCNARAQEHGASDCVIAIAEE